MHHSDHTLTALSHLVAGLSFGIAGEPEHDLGLFLHLLLELRSAVCVPGCAGKRASDERDARADGRTTDGHAGCNLWHRIAPLACHMARERREFVSKVCSSVVREWRAPLGRGASCAGGSRVTAARARSRHSCQYFERFWLTPPSHDAMWVDSGRKYRLKCGAAPAP